MKTIPEGCKPVNELTVGQLSKILNDYSDDTIIRLVFIDNNAVTLYVDKVEIMSEVLTENDN